MEVGTPPPMEDLYTNSQLELLELAQNADLVEALDIQDGMSTGRSSQCTSIAEVDDDDDHDDEDDDDSDLLSFMDHNGDYDDEAETGLLPANDDDDDDDDISDEEEEEDEDEILIPQPVHQMKKKPIASAAEKKTAKPAINDLIKQFSEFSIFNGDTLAKKPTPPPMEKHHVVAVEEETKATKAPPKKRAQKKKKEETEKEQQPESELVVEPKFLRHPFGHEPTIWFEYPKWLNLKRDKTGMMVEDLDTKSVKLTWKSYWERNCLKDVLKTAGFEGGKVSNAMAMKKVGNATLVWTKHVKNWRELGSNQRHNHFAGSWTIGRKDRLAFTISKKQRQSQGAFNILPECFILPQHTARLRHKLINNPKKHAWIRKPLASSQGRGIKVLTHQEVYKMVTKQLQPSNPATTSNAREEATGAKKKRKLKFLRGKSNAVAPMMNSGKGKDELPPASAKDVKACVIQKYIERPLLINKYKFDIRIYVVVTSFNPLRAYMFPEGLVRFCTKPYSTNNKKNQFSHLTNYSINKKSDDFQHNQSATEDSVGSKWSLSALFHYMNDKYGLDKTEKVKNDMKSVIVKTLIAADDDINIKMSSQVKNSRSCFELFGFDIMLDRNLRAWLIEVNISPSLMTASPLDKKVKTLLICDALHLVGIPVPNPKDAKKDVASICSSTSVGSNNRRNSRSKDIEQGRNLNNLAKKTWGGLSQEDKIMVEQIVAEKQRKGHFERIFPPENDAKQHEEYMKLFTTRRYNNVLVQQFENVLEKRFVNGGTNKKKKKKNH